jgi:CheY-like chemotaxis protein
VDNALSPAFTYAYLLARGPGSDDEAEELRRRIHAAVQTAAELLSSGAASGSGPSARGASSIPPSEHREPIHPLVLLVDDDRAVRRAVARFLRGSIFRIESHASGAEALAAFRRSPRAYAAALVDLEMPDMGGVEVVHALRAQRSDLPIVIATGHAPDPGFLGASGLEGCSVIPKPFEPDSLHEVLRGAAFGGS